MIDYEAYRFFENEDGMKELAKEMIKKNIDLAKSLQFELNAQLQDKEVAEGSIDWDIKVPEIEYKFDLKLTLFFYRSNIYGGQIHQRRHP